MDYEQAFAVSAAGMTLERTRVDVAALNLANANTIQTAGGSRYLPQRVVALTAPGIASSDPATASVFAQAFADGTQAAGMSVPQASVQSAEMAPRKVYEPGNPFADTKGYVSYAGVDAATEMVTMMSAVRSYEANVVAMNTAKTIALKALDIGGGS